MEKSISIEGYALKIENGILCIHCDSTPPTNSTVQASIDAIHLIVESKKFPILINAKHAIPLNKSQRSQVKLCLNECGTSVALLDNNIFAQIVFELILKLNKPAIPMRMFANEEKAITWLKESVD